MTSSPRIRKRSVAAFMFMPQFRLCFQGFSQVVPVFMRILAVMFEQAGLIARNHPATRYGMQGVRRHSMGALLGEAWVTLRSSKPSPYQWGIFASVLFMIALVVASLFMAVMTVCFGFGTAAKAQLFGLAGKDTSTASGDMPDASGGGVGMFDKSIPPVTSDHGDYGLMILNKMLRQGMEGMGAPLQNAMQSLMAVYNSGIMVIAGIMLAWAILSIVIDAARTGRVEGGRHNLVWAPIRIVFALGLLVPLGPTGFSSGQFLVVKLAEWGSNLATNAWGDYVGAVAADSLILDQTPANGTNLVRTWVDMWMCRVAYNAITYDSTGALPSDQEVKRVINVNSSQGGSESFSFTNSTNGNMCGTVTASNPAGDTVLQLALTDPDLTSRAIAEFKRDMANAYYQLFFSGPASWPVLEPATNHRALEFACGFISQHVVGDPPGDLAQSPLVLSGQCTEAQIQACMPIGPPAAGEGPGTGNGPWPDTTCMDDLVTAYYNHVNGAMATALGTFKTAVAANIKASMTARGWPDMGRWFLQLGQANSATVSAKMPSVSIVPGIVAQSEIDFSGMTAMGDGPMYYSQSDLDRTMNRIANRYKQWWENADAIYGGGTPPAQVSVNGAGGAITKPDPSKTAPETGSSSAAAASFKNPSGMSTEGVLDKLASLFSFMAIDPFVDIVEPQDPNIYPFTQIAALGSEMFWWGVAFIAVPTIIVLALALAPMGIASTLVNSPLYDILSMLGTTLIIAGGMLKFYIPILPFIRVAFSVLTWMVSVFEAVMMVPLAALAHVSTQGDGLSGQARHVWILWLNVLLRPVLTVLGYVGAIMVFNTFVIYFHSAFVGAVQANFDVKAFTGWLNAIAMCLIYGFTIYTIANSSFKLLDLIPNALMRWMGGGSRDTDFDESRAVSGGLQAAVGMASSLRESAVSNMREFVKGRGGKGDGDEPDLDGSGARKGGDAPDPNQPDVPQPSEPTGSGFTKELSRFDKQTETARSALVKQGASESELSAFDKKISTMRERAIEGNVSSTSADSMGERKDGPILPSLNISVGPAKAADDAAAVPGKPASATAKADSPSDAPLGDSSGPVKKD